MVVYGMPSWETAIVWNWTKASNDSQMSIATQKRQTFWLINPTCALKVADLLIGLFQLYGTQVDHKCVSEKVSSLLVTTGF